MFESLLSGFNTIADEVGWQLNAMLDTVSGGRVPSAVQINAFEETINRLQEQYNAIYEATCSLVSADELPEKGCPVSAYAQAASDSKTRLLLAQATAAEAILKRFICVKSLVNTFSNALEPFQEAARNTLAQANSLSSSTKSELLLEAATAPDLFLKAMDMDDSAEEDKLFDSLEIYYPSKVQIGLARKKYYVPDELTTLSANQVDTSVFLTSVTPSEAVSSGSACAIPTVEYPPQAAEPAGGLAGDPGSDIRQAEPPELLHANNKVKVAPANASSFKRDVMNMSQNVRVLLPLFTHLGILTADQAWQFGVLMHGFPENDGSSQQIVPALRQMASKNILAAYPLPPSDAPTYCLTEYGCACLKKHDIAVKMRAFWKIRISKPIFMGRQTVGRALVEHAVFQNDLLLQYLRYAEGMMNRQDRDDIIESIKWKGSHYTVLVILDDIRVPCCLVHAKEDFASVEEPLLIIAEEYEQLRQISTDSQQAFVLCNGTLSPWDRSSLVTPDVNGTSTETVPESEVAEEGPSILESAVPAVTEVAPPREVEESGTPLQIGSNPQPKAVDTVSDCEQRLASDELSGLTAPQLAELLLERNITPSDDVPAYHRLISSLVEEGQAIDEEDTVVNSLAQASVLCKALLLCGPEYETACRKLLIAVDSPLQTHHYDQATIFSLFAGDKEGTSLHLMTILRALFAPSAAYDYSLQAYAESLFDKFDAYFSQFSLLKPLYNLFLQIKPLSPSGFSVSVLHSFCDNSAKQEVIQQLRRCAERLLPEPTISSKLNTLVPMIRDCFGAESELHLCMEIIAEGKNEDREIVEEIFLKYCDIGKDHMPIISQEKICAVFDQCWKNALKEKRGPRELTSTPRAKLFDGFNSRLELMGAWLQATAADEGKPVSPQFHALRKNILSELNAVLEAIPTTCQPFDRTILLAGLSSIHEKLRGHLLVDKRPFADFLRTGFLCVDENGLPVIETQFSSVPYYEPWRNVVQHIASPVHGLRSTLAQIKDPSCPHLYDNIGQAKAIYKYLNDYCGESNRLDQFAMDAHTVRDAAKRAVDKFKASLELAFAYGRIVEQEKEDLLDSVEHFQGWFAEYENFGCLRAFLDALRKAVEDATQKRLRQLEQDIDERQRTVKTPESEAVLIAARKKLQEPDRNFAVAEEYINRFDAGVTEFISSGVSTEEENIYLHFVSDDVFKKLYDLCWENRSGNLRSFGVDYVERELKARGFSAQYLENSRNLLKSLPNRPEKVNTVVTLLLELGLMAKSSQIVYSTNTLTHLTVEVTPDDKGKAEYAHPVDLMGTKLKSPVDVVCLFGNLQGNDIVNRVCALELSHTAIVLLNGALDLAGRRQIAERFHREKSGQNPFLLIDWVLLLHLALYQKTERLPILLSCTLPYTSSFQPFVTTGSVSDEMFIGRKRELNQILDPKGPVIVYGGRQLGKTALLERAFSRANQPAKKEYAVLVRSTALNTEKELAEVIAQELHRSGLPLSPVTDMSELCRQLRQMYGAKKWCKLLVLIDEADTILVEFRNQTPAYAPLIPLSDLKRETNNDFKFVFAGLHNVCRAAAEPNTIFGQLGGPLCIKPLSPADAMELLSRPLRYMGFKIRPEDLEHILVSTNFYPGIVHYVGYSLVENLSTKYADYYQASRGNPPYDLTDKQLGDIMSGDALNEKINERIRWTLEVDPRYFMLARCIAFLYYAYPDSNKIGYPAKTILEYADLLEISCLSGLSESKCFSLLLELVEMGILVRPTNETFRLRQRRFLDAIGTSPEKIERDIREAEGGGIRA